MPLQDRALNLLATMNGLIDFDHPTVFVTHSYGGLLLKAMLRKVRDYPDVCGGFEESMSGVAFFGTPHTGSRLSDYLTALGKIGRASPAVHELNSSSAVLRDLNQWFRANVSELNLRIWVFFETLKTRGVLVVDPASSDPGISGVLPIPIDANHVELPKPTSRDARVASIISLIKNAPIDPQVSSESNQFLEALLRAPNHQIPYLIDEIEYLMGKFPEDKTLRTAHRYAISSLRNADASLARHATDAASPPQADVKMHRRRAMWGAAPFAIISMIGLAVAVGDFERLERLLTLIQDFVSRLFGG